MYIYIYIYMYTYIYIWRVEFATACIVVHLLGTLRQALSAAHNRTRGPRRGSQLSRMRSKTLGCLRRRCKGARSRA